MAEHSFIVITEDPNGVSPIKATDRQAIIRAYVGDTISILFKIPDGADPILRFVVRNNVFSPDVVYEAELSEDLTGDLVQVIITAEDSAELRRGSYAFSLTAESEASGYAARRVRVIATGTLLMDYAPSSPHRDVPYKH